MLSNEDNPSAVTKHCRAYLTSDTNHAAFVAHNAVICCVTILISLSISCARCSRLSFSDLYLYRPRQWWTIVTSSAKNSRYAIVPSGLDENVRPAESSGRVWSYAQRSRMKFTV